MTPPMATDLMSASVVDTYPSTPVTVTANRQITAVIPSEQGSTSSSNSQESSCGIDGKRSSKKRSLDTEGIPQPSAPKRMTIALQKRQHQKLLSPFRSPLLSKPNPGNVSTPNRTRTGPSLLSPLSLAFRNTDKDDPTTPSKDADTSLITALPRTQLSKNTGFQSRPASSVKATSQFKSPLASSSTTSAHSRINTSRQIQELERKLQLLKRASKIKKDGDEEKLVQLVQKWRGVGREAAYELWQIVRDNDGSSDAPYPGTNSKSSGGSFSSGWFSSPDKRTNNGFSGQSNWGWDAPPDERKPGDENDEDAFEPESPSKLEDTLYRSLRKKPTVVRTSMLPPTPRGAYFEQYKRETNEERHYTGEDGHDEDNGDDEGPDPSVASSKSLGTMLLQIGIAHETLGWVEDEGDFVDT
ncbi:hypothetical protein M0805_002932 [Coniferiporia weirii]|nr:hypothetical protein M0805_002932 [Coniferiporia weirii]